LPRSELTMGRGSWVKWVNEYGWVKWVMVCDPLTYDRLTDDQVHQISRTIYTTIKTTRMSVTDMDALSAAGWPWSLHGKQT